MKITLLGNCQTKALTWYIAQLHEEFDAAWICMEALTSQHWGPPPGFRGKKIKTIVDSEQAIERLRNSDYVIFQHLDTKTSKKYNFQELQKHVQKGKLISISVMFYNPSQHILDGSFLQGMIERAKRHNIDIPAHKIIEKHGSKIKMIAVPTHPAVFYFLELVREICNFTGWEYYTDDQYYKYMEQRYPFG